MSWPVQTPDGVCPECGKTLYRFDLPYVSARQTSCCSPQSLVDRVAAWPHWETFAFAFFGFIIGVVISVQM